MGELSRIEECPYSEKSNNDEDYKIFNEKYHNTIKSFPKYIIKLIKKKYDKHKIKYDSYNEGSNKIIESVNKLYNSKKKYNNNYRKNNKNNKNNKNEDEMKKIKNKIRDLSIISNRIVAHLKLNKLN